MLWFALRKLAAFAATVLITAWLIYAVLAASPGAPQAGFFGWLMHAVTGDFGVSSSTSQPIGDLIGGRLAVTVPLALLAMLAAAIVGLGVGYLAALRPGRWSDKALTALAEIGIATPNFWLGMVLVLAFAMGLHWLPPGGFVPWQDNVGGAIVSLILPALALGLPAAAALAIVTRDALAAARSAAYAVAAQARGLTAHEAFATHGLRTALLPVLQALATQCTGIIAGTVVVENVFYVPGLGRLILDALATHDLAIVGGGLLVLILLMSGTLFLLQLGLAWADPRLRSGAIE